MAVARARPVVPLAAHARLVVPVLSGSGGSGRSTVSGLLAAGLAALGPAVVLDTASAVSPWRFWTSGGSGLESLPPDQPQNAAQVEAAASALGLGGRGVRVLTDRRLWSAQPLVLPGKPQAWLQLAALGGWPVAVADTGFSVISDLVDARWEGIPPRSAAWWQISPSVPLIVASSSADGLEEAAVALAALADARLDAERCVLVVVDMSGARVPRQVKAALTMLQARVGAVVDLPYDPAIRGQGLRATAELASATWRAVDRLTSAVVQRAEQYFGPLRAPTPPALLPSAPMEVPRDVQPSH